MEYQWDPEKEKLNYKKHNVRFSETVIVLEDPFAITIEDNSSKNEQRFINF